MTYNLTIKNNGALPIPYVTKVGDAFAVDQLYTKKELLCDALYIGATPQKQILIHCTHNDYIFDLSSDLEINLHNKADDTQPVSNANWWKQ